MQWKYLQYSIETKVKQVKDVGMVVDKSNSPAVGDAGDARQCVNEINQWKWEAAQVV